MDTFDDRERKKKPGLSEQQPEDEAQDEADETRVASQTKGASEGMQPLMDKRSDK